MLVFPMFPFMSSLLSLIFSSHITAMDSAPLPRLLPCNAFGNQRLSPKSKGVLNQLQVQKDSMYHAKCSSYHNKPMIRSHHLRFSNSMTKLQDSTESIFDRRKFKSHLNAIPKHTSGNEPEDAHMQGFWTSTVWNKLNTLYRFCRPYAAIGTIIGVISASLAPVESMADLTPTFLMGLLMGLMPSVLNTIYSATVNDIYDVNIDKINKPYHPLASGELSMAAGIAFTVFIACLSIMMAFMSQSPPLLWTILIRFLLASAYSIDLPYLRWKLSTFLAPFYVYCEWAITTPIGIYAHIQTQILGRPFIITRSLVVRMVALGIITLVIALFKDIPDVEGDTNYGSKSLCVLLGKEWVFHASVSLLLTGYLAAMVVGAFSSSMINKLITVVGHGTLALVAWQRAQSVDLESKESSHSYYLLIWKFFYAENILTLFMQ